MSWLEAAQTTPARRMKISNLVTQETKQVMFNPTEWEHVIQTNWERFTIPGLGYQPRHYINTSNAVFPMELFYRATTLAELNEMDDSKRFFESLCYPIESDTVGSGGLPKVLFTWPKVASIVVTLNSLSHRYVMFTRAGEPRVARMRVEFEEIRSIQLLSSSVRRSGLLRADSQRVLTADPFAQGGE